MKKIYFGLLLLLFVGMSHPFFAQSSDCSYGGTGLTVGASCTTVAFNSTNNTNYWNSFSGCNSADRDDAWWWFTATATSTTITYNSASDAILHVFTGACATNMTYLSCSDGTSSGNETVTLATTIGVSYAIRIQQYNSDANMNGTICVYSTPAGGGCTPNTVIGSIPYSQTGFNTSGAGDDFSSTDACGSSYMNGDDYVFTYTPSINECVNIALTNTSTWVGVFVTNGCPSMGASCVASNTNSSGNPSVSGVNLIAGVTYFFTISTYPSPQTTPFDISITACPPPPANDAPCSATAATVNADLLCGSVTAGTVASATNSGIAACAGTGADDDVWFSFVATSTVHNFDLLNVAGSVTDMVHEIFSGACGSLSSIACSDPNSSQWSGFTVGVTYYVRVYTYTSTGGQNTTFNLCIGTPPPPPSNDEPCGAIDLNVNIGSCAFQSANIGTSSTISVGMPAPGCSSLGPDVWYKVTVPAGGLIIDLAPNGGPTDFGMAWYTGSSCSNLTTLVECDDDDSQNGAMPMICRTGASCTIPGDCAQNAKLPTGTVVYVRIWEYGGDSFGPFDICAYEPAPAGAASNCGNALAIASLPFSEAGQTTCCRANTYGIALACASAYQGGEDYIYSYTPAANQTIDITLTGTLSYTGIFVTDKCPSAGGVACVASATSFSGNPTLCGVSLTAGTTYYIMIDTDPTPNCTPFNINITSSSSPTCNLNYTSSVIAFAPDLNAGTNIALPIDDRFSSSYIPIGFTFCFDGFGFSQALLSSNGYLIFDPISCASNLPSANAAPAGYSGYSISAAIPNATNAPRNAILFPWQDIDPSKGGTIKYQTLGITPNRRFVITFDQVPYFDCNAKLFTGQLKLYETSNTIEMHIAKKEICTTWNGGYGILGLHNYNGTIAVINAGYNYPTNYTLTNQAFRFVSNCGPACIVLPVKLMSFTAVSKGNYNQLLWSTSTEVNNDYFVVEASEDLINFNEVGRVDGGNNSNTVLNYQFKDNTVYENVIYYRLKQVDFDGAFTYSDIVAVKKINEGEIELYPNPAKEVLYIDINSAKQDVYTIKYINVLGATVQEKIIVNKGSNTYQANEFKQLESGIYFIQVLNQSNEVIKYQKLVKE